MLFVAALALGVVSVCAAAGVDTVSVWDGNGNQANASFGYSVATAGDVDGDGFSDLLVGARGYNAGQIDEGRVFLYPGSATGPATVASWTSESDQLLAFYGSSVAGAGDVNGDGYADALVGAPSYDGALSNEGRAYLYLGSSGGLGGTADWTQGGGQQSATFGSAVANAGDVNGDGYDDIIIGARGWDAAEANAGRAFVYHGGAAGPDSVADWTLDGTQDDEALGWSVASAGDVNADGYGDVIVGAFFHTDLFTREGAAWVYLGSATGLDSIPNWTAVGAQAGANFGWSVAPAGDVNGDGYADVIVGARYHDAGLVKEGRVTVYLGSAAGVEATADWTVDGGQADGYLGWSVATAGDVNGDGLADVIVGGYRTDVAWLDDGQARIYLGGAGGLEMTPAWTGSSGQQGAGFGWSVASAGDADGDGFGDVVVGAHFHDDGQVGEGRASVFRGGAELPATASWWKGVSGASGVAYGFDVDYAGDVNGDGFADLLVADPLADLSVSGEGRVDLFLGAALGPDVSPAWSSGGTQAGENFGRAVSPAGDVDGDGYEDVLCGAPFRTQVFGQEGRASLYLGSAIGLAPVAAWTADGGELFAELGASVAGIGDVNGDGYADFAAGAPGKGGAVAGSGVALVFHGSAGGSGPSPDQTLDGFQTGARFGAAIAAAGDVNGDGYADVIVGEPLALGTVVEEGRAHVYLGAPGGLGATPDWTVAGGQVGAQFGATVAPAGDVDGDGYADVLVTAPLWAGTLADEGRTALYRGGPAGLAATADWTWESGQAGAQLDGAASAGDVNGDGFGDVLVGVSRHTGGFVQEGRVVLFAGSAAGLTLLPEREWFGGRAFARLGSAVTGRGDPDGNGWPDLLLGARGWSDSTSGGGAAFLHAANGASAGGAVAIQQRRLDDSAPIAPGGRSDSESAFRVRALGGSAAGRALVAMEWEAKPLGVPFDGSGTQTTASLDTGAPQPGVGSRVDLSGTVSGLTGNTAYRWRVRTVSPVPFFPGSPWFSLAANGRTEIDVRTNGAVAAPIRPAPSPALRLAVHPTPFRSAAVIRFALATPTDVSLRIHDVAGRLVADLHDGPLLAGEHGHRWDGRNRRGGPVAPGVYWVHLSTATGEAAAPVVRVR